jgi:flagellar biosynthesis/type III secretory pathway chaperone
MQTTSEQLSQLEDTLVSEFRLLQSLVKVTRKESSALLDGNYSVLTPIVEDIEAIIDQLNRMENTRQKITDSLAKAMNISSMPSTVRSLLPFMEKEQSARVRRLCDGITALSDQDRVLNLKVNTLSQSWIDMIHSTQAYLLSFFQTPATYQLPGSKQNANLTPVWATEHRA